MIVTTVRPGFAEGIMARYGGAQAGWLPPPMRLATPAEAGEAAPVYTTHVHNLTRIHQSITENTVLNLRLQFRFFARLLEHKLQLIEQHTHRSLAMLENQLGIPAPGRISRTLPGMPANRTAVAVPASPPAPTAQYPQAAPVPAPVGLTHPQPRVGAPPAPTGNAPPAQGPAQQNAAHTQAQSTAAHTPAPQAGQPHQAPAASAPPVTIALPPPGGRTTTALPSTSAAPGAQAAVPGHLSVATPAMAQPYPVPPPTLLPAMRDILFHPLDQVIVRTRRATDGWAQAPPPAPPTPAQTTAVVAVPPMPAMPIQGAPAPAQTAALLAVPPVPAISRQETPAQPPPGTTPAATLHPRSAPAQAAETGAVAPAVPQGRRPAATPPAPGHRAEHPVQAAVPLPGLFPPVPQVFPEKPGDAPLLNAKAGAEYMQPPMRLPAKAQATQGDAYTRPAAAPGPRPVTITLPGPVAHGTTPAGTTAGQAPMAGRAPLAYPQQAAPAALHPAAPMTDGPPPVQVQAAPAAARMQPGFPPPVGFSPQAVVLWAGAAPAGQQQKPAAPAAAPAQQDITFHTRQAEAPAVQQHTTTHRQTALVDEGPLADLQKEYDIERSVRAITQRVYSELERRLRTERMRKGFL